jgi:hypothetical protein
VLKAHLARAADEAKEKEERKRAAEPVQEPGAKRTNIGPTYTQPTLHHYDSKADADKVDEKIFFFFSECGIAFNVARHPAWLEMVQAIKTKAPLVYTPPSSEKLRTTLLVGKVGTHLVACACCAMSPASGLQCSAE